MRPISSIYYHGAKGDKILDMIETGMLPPDKNGTLFFGRYNWEQCFMHGGDRKRRASFVIQVRIELTDAHTSFVETPGVDDTVKIQTDSPIPVEVLELYVRQLTDGEGSLRKVATADAITKYLTSLSPK